MKPSTVLALIAAVLAVCCFLFCMGGIIILIEFHQAQPIYYSPLPSGPVLRLEPDFEPEPVERELRVSPEPKERRLRSIPVKEE